MRFSHIQEFSINLAKCLSSDTFPQFLKPFAQIKVLKVISI